MMTEVHLLNGGKGEDPEKDELVRKIFSDLFNAAL